MSKPFSLFIIFVLVFSLFAPSLTFAGDGNNNDFNSETNSVESDSSNSSDSVENEVSVSESNEESEANEESNANEESEANGSVTLSWTDSLRSRTLGSNTNQGELFYDNSQTETILERI